MNFSILFPLWIVVGVATAQTPAYMHYGVQDGLPGNLVYCGLQDRRGLLWFGTDKGLASFDGSQFRTYGLADGLPDLEVLSMKEDSKGRLWLFCFRKKPCYMQDGQIITDRQDTTLAQIEFNSGTYAISEDANKGLWYFELADNAFYSDGSKLKAYKFPNGVSTLEKVGNDYLMLGKSDIMLYSGPQKIESLYHINHFGGLPSISVSDNRIFYAYTNLLILYEWLNGSISEVARVPQQFGQTYKDKSGRFWACAPSIGAICFDNQSRDLTNPTTYMNHKKVTTMFEDNQGTFWFCTADEGVFALPQHTPINFNSDIFTSKNIRYVTGLKTGAILAGDDTGIVYKIEGTKITKHPLGSRDGYNQIRDIETDGKFIWTATDEGLCKTDLNFNGFKKYLFPSSLKAIQLRQDELWFASSSKLGYLIKPKYIEQTKVPKRFTSVTADFRGNIWAGCMDGLYSELDSFQYNWGDRFPELKSRIMAVVPASDKQLWIATPEKGLISVEIQSGRIIAIDVINQSLGLNIQNIQSLFAEPNGCIWMATNKGVYGLMTDGSLTQYDRYDGLIDDDVHSVFARNDTLWVATVAGLTMFNLKQAPDKGDFATFFSHLDFLSNKQAQTIHLLDSIGDHTTIKLTPTSTNIELSLAALDYKSRGNLRFEVERTVMLLPFFCLTFENLTDWVIQKIRREPEIVTTVSTNYRLDWIPAGQYLFKATAINKWNIRSQKPDEMVILKLPFWYQTIWFYLFLWVILAFSIWRIYSYRMAYRDMKTATLTLQLKTLQSQMNPHFIGNSIHAIQQFLHPPDPIRLSDFISKFVRILRQTIHFSEVNFIPFSEEMDYHFAYLEMIKLRFGNNFHYEIKGTDDIPENTPIPCMLLQPIIENATIHGLNPTGVSNLVLEFNILKDKLWCTVTDDGVGYNASQKHKVALKTKNSDSKGEEILKKKINALNRMYNLDISYEMKDLSSLSTPQHGTRIIISYSPSKIWTSTKQRPFRLIDQS